MASRGAGIALATTAFASVALAQGATLLVVQPWNSLRDVAFHLAVSGTALLAAPVALLLVWKPPAEAIATRWAGLLASVVPLTWSSFWVLVTLDRPIGAGAWLELVGHTGWLALVAPWLTLGAFLGFSARFPADLRTVALRSSTSRSGWASRSVDAIQRMSRRPGALWAASAGIPAGALALGLIAALVARPFHEEPEIVGMALGTMVLLGWISVAALAGVRNLGVGLRVADPERRRGGLWAVMGFLGAGWLLLAAMLSALLDLLDVVPEAGPLGWAAPALALVAPASVVAGLYLAVFYHGALDPDQAIRRSAVSGSVALVLALFFAGAEMLLSDVVLRGMASGGEWSIWIAGALAALAFGPVQAALKRRVDAWLGEGLPSSTDGV